MIDRPPLRVLVTRSEPGASETAERLSARNYTPVVEPLFVIQPLAAALPDFDAVAFTSLNGVRVFAGMSSRRDMRVFCVGDRTADAAREAGFAEVQSADGDIEDLLRLIESRLPRSVRLLHAANEESRGDLSGRLSRAGWQARFAPIFAATPVAGPGPALAVHLDGTATVEAALVHSPRAGAILAGLLAAAPQRARLDIAAISRAAGEPLHGLVHRLQIANRPNEDELLNSLERLTDMG